MSRRRLERALGTKLQMRVDTSRDHRFYEFYVDDEWVLQTKISTGTGYRDLGDQTITKIAKQLRVTKNQLGDLVNCPMSYADYVEHLRKSGKLD